MFDEDLWQSRQGVITQLCVFCEVENAHTSSRAVSNLAGYSCCKAHMTEILVKFQEAESPGLDIPMIIKNMLFMGLVDLGVKLNRHPNLGR